MSHYCITVFDMVIYYITCDISNVQT